MVYLYTYINTRIVLGTGSYSYNYLLFVLGIDKISILRRYFIRSSRNNKNSGANKTCIMRMVIC